MTVNNTTPSQSRLFKPLKVGHANLNHRIVLAPLTRYRNDDEHVPLPLMEKYYSERAAVPGTLVISEATAIAHEDEGQPNAPGFITEAQAAGWSKVIDAVHANGSYYFQQIWGMGRAADAKYLAGRGLKYLSSSAVPMKEGDVTPEAMTEEHILATIRNFVDTAKRVVAAGGDGIEIHSAHGYLLDQFLSDNVNKRTDKWGGSVENRSRLLLEVVKAVVDAIGAERVGIRLSPYASFQNAQKSDIQGQYTYLIDKLKEMNVSFAYLSLVEATGDPAALLLGADTPNAGKTLDFILERWNNASPVMVAGGYTPESAAWAVEEHYKKWDVLVAFGRYFIANPDLVFKMQHGLELTKWNRATFYKNKSAEGYIDYPFSEDFIQAFPSAHAAVAAN
jgi:NADPH2 dehydrogenase